MQPAENNPYSCGIAHSLAWPGAVAVAKDKLLVNIYVGNGVKYLATNYTPPPPPPIQGEYVAQFSKEDGEEDPMVEQRDPDPVKEEGEEDKENEEGGEGVGDEEDEDLGEDLEQ